MDHFLLPQLYYHTASFSAVDLCDQIQTIFLYDALESFLPNGIWSKAVNPVPKVAIWRVSFISDGICYKESTFIFSALPFKFDLCRYSQRLSTGISFSFMSMENIVWNENLIWDLRSRISIVDPDTGSSLWGSLISRLGSTFDNGDVRSFIKCHSPAESKHPTWPGWRSDLAWYKGRP